MELEGLAVEPLKKHIKPSDLQALQKLIDTMRTRRRDEVLRDIKRQSGARPRKVIEESLDLFWKQQKRFLQA
jgi:hypothetical protein